MTFQRKAAILQTFLAIWNSFPVIIKGQLAYVSSTRRLTTGTKRVNCAGNAVEFGGVRLVKCGILATARCSACMNEMHRWWRGVRGPRHPPNNRKVMLVCAVSFNRCETLLTETSKFRLKRSKKLVDGSITVKVNWRKRREEASARLMIINQHLRNRGQILSVAMPVIQPAFITDKGLNYMLCHPGFAFNRRWLCFNGVWRLSAVQMAAPNCTLFTQTRKKMENAGGFSSKH